MVASPQKKTNDCLLITMNSICCNFVLELGSYAKKKEDKKTLGATGRRSEMTMQLHKSDIVIPQAMIWHVYPLVTTWNISLSQPLLLIVSFDQQNCNMTHGPFCCHHWHWLSVTTLKWSPVMHQHQCICEAKKEGLVYVWGAVMIQKMQLDTLCVIDVGRGGQC